MIQGQCDPPSGQRRISTPYTPRTSLLLQQHPVLIPLGLVAASAGLCMLGFFANTLFPVFALIGIPSTLICLLLALVFGIAGILASIISIIENVDQKRLHAMLFSKPEEGA
jgi:hypothetical protein